MNERVGGADSLVCVSRPRYFGKLYTVNMLAAYYDGSCDFRRLFDDRITAGYDGYEEHINRYNVISLDITGFISNARIEKVPLTDISARISKAVKKNEILEMDPDRPDPKRIYSSVIKEYGSRILLVGISYNKDAETGTRTHTYKIVEYDVSE